MSQQFIIRPSQRQQRSTLHSSRSYQCIFKQNQKEFSPYMQGQFDGKTLYQLEIQKEMKRTLSMKPLDLSRLNLFIRPYSRKQNEEAALSDRKFKNYQSGKHLVSKGYLSSRLMEKYLRPEKKKHVRELEKQVSSVVPEKKEDQLKLANYFLNSKGTHKEKQISIKKVLERYREQSTEDGNKYKTSLMRFAYNLSQCIS